MQKNFISEFKEGMPVDGVFLCAHKALLKDKNGKPYLNIKLVDRSGTIEARVWDKANYLVKNFDKMDYVRTKGHVVSFQDHLQLNISEITRVPEREVNPLDFISHTTQDIPAMYEKLLQICREDMKNKWVRPLVLSIIEDPLYAPAFKNSPAAKSNHHGWIGGLLEHVLKLCQVGQDVLKHYPMVQGDLVLAGLILHDFGKIQELTTERTIDYSDKGRLVGHLTISIEILIKKAEKIPNFPEKILQHLMHILLSHHGRLEYGSPKEPMTLEALMVHHLDNMDSKLQGFLDAVARETENPSPWAPPSYMFNSPLYKNTSIDLEEATAPKPLPPKEKKKNPKEPLKTNLGEILGKQLKT